MNIATIEALHLILETAHLNASPLLAVDGIVVKGIYR